jgi:hypothetical protein
MNWVLLLRITKANNDTILFKMFFTDISLSIPFIKIERVLDNVEIYSEIEKQIITMLNNKVALKDDIYIIYDEKQEYDFLKNHMPNIANRISETINLKSFLLISLHLNKENYKNFLEYW